MLRREITLACIEVLDMEVIVQKRAVFYEILEMTPNDTWKMSNDMSPRIFFYQEVKGNPILHEDERPEHEDIFDLRRFDGLDHFGIWRSFIYKDRLEKAAEWLFSRQSAIQKCHELGLKPFIAIYVYHEGGSSYMDLPSQFVTACGQANLHIQLYFQ